MLVVISVSMVSNSTYSPANIFLFVLLHSIQDAGCSLDLAAVNAWPRDVRGLKQRDFDLVWERRLCNLDRRLCGDRDLDDERELQLPSLFWFPRLRLHVWVWPSLVV